jgi:hypothetical protein
MRKSAIAIAFVISIENDLHADAANGIKEIAKVSRINLVLENNVDGSCLTNSEHIKNSINTILSRGGFLMDDSSEMVLDVNFMGGRSSSSNPNSSCLISSEFHLNWLNENTGKVVIAYNKVIYLGANARNDAAKKKADEFANEVVTNILRACMKTGDAP